MAPPGRPISAISRTTDIVARRGGRWVIIGNYPALCYPQATGRTP